MQQGVKRQSDESSIVDSPEKKLRVDEMNFEQMKKEADEARRNVLDNYLKECAAQTQTKGSKANSTRTLAKSRRSSTSGSDVKTKTRTRAVRRSMPLTDATEASLSTIESTRKTSADSGPSTPCNPETSVQTTEPKVNSDQFTTQSAKIASPLLHEVASSSPAVLTHNSSSDDERVAAAEVLDCISDQYGELYPSIALSDAFNAIGHLCAAFIAAENGHSAAAFGFLSVWLAAIVGVLRFGVNEHLFQQANGNLADLAGFVGYPMIGMSFAAHHFSALHINVIFIAFILVAWEALTRSFLEKNKDAAKLATNIVFFVGPIAAVCQETDDYPTLAALVAFILAGIVVTPHHDNRILGVRCVDWFHYIIGATACVFARGLGRGS